MLQHKIITSKKTSLIVFLTPETSDLPDTLFTFPRILKTNRHVMVSASDRPVRYLRLEAVPSRFNVSVADIAFHEYGTGGWKSLGRKTADADSLVYEGVPGNAVFWLRDLTKEREEQQFVLDSSG